VAAGAMANAGRRDGYIELNNNNKTIITKGDNDECPDLGWERRIERKAKKVADEDVLGRRVTENRTPSHTPNCEECDGTLGAGYDKCLDANDIDGLLERLQVPWTCDNAERVSAWEFFNARTKGAECLQRFRERLMDMLSKDGRVVVPVHVRHHWLTVVMRRVGESVHMASLDSAPSAAARRDVNMWMITLFRGTDVLITPQPFPRQKRFSEECGLFTVLAVTAHMRADRVSWDEIADAVVSLADWRRDIAGGRYGLPTFLRSNLLDRSPQDLQSSTRPWRQERELKAGYKIDSEESGVSAMDTAITLNGLAKEKITADRVLDAWAQRAADQAATQQEKDLALVDAEWSSASVADRRARRAEFARRRKRRIISANNTALYLRDAPEDVRQSKNWNLIVAYANRLEQEARNRAAHNDFEMLAQGARPGEMVDARIVKAVIDAMHPKQSAWTIVDPLQLDFQGRKSIMDAHFYPKISDHVTAVLWQDQHFTQASWRRGQRFVTVRDSLDDKARKTGSDAAVDVFKRFLAQRGVVGDLEIHRAPCKRQGANECAFEAVANLMLDVTGVRGQFTREYVGSVVAAARKKPISERMAFLTQGATWEAALPPAQEPPPRYCNLGLNPQPKSLLGKDDSDTRNSRHDETTIAHDDVPRQEASTIWHQHDPYAGNVLAPPADEKGPGPEKKPCCGREQLVAGWCAWHHPLLSKEDRRCCAKAKSGRQCREKVLSVCGEQQVVYRSEHCWYHASALDKERVKAIVSGQDTNEHIRLGFTEPNQPMKHDAVRNFLQVCRKGEDIFLDVHMAPWNRISVLARVDTTHKVTPTARRCRTCDGWHIWQEGPLIIPSWEARYFGIRRAEASELRAASELTPECHDEDAGSDVDDNGNPELGEQHDDSKAPLFHSFSGSQFHAPLVADARRWFVYSEKPPHVHAIAWNNMSRPTRLEHQRWLLRLRAAPPEMHNATLGQAAVEVVLRLANERQWKWATIASKLSSVGAALRNLPLYTNCSRPVILRDEPMFASALAHAIRNAKVGAWRPKKSDALSHDAFVKAGKALTGGSWILLQLGWYLAVFLGPVRARKNAPSSRPGSR